MALFGLPQIEISFSFAYEELLTCEVVLFCALKHVWFTDPCQEDNCFHTNGCECWIKVFRCNVETVSNRCVYDKKQKDFFEKARQKEKASIF